MNEAQEAAEGLLLDALAVSIASTYPNAVGTVLVTSYVVIAAFTDEHGQAGIFTGTPDTQRSHETLGLTEFARLKWAAEVVAEGEP